MKSSMNQTNYNQLNPISNWDSITPRYHKTCNPRHTQKEALRVLQNQLETKGFCILRMDRKSIMRPLTECCSQLLCAVWI